MPSALRLSDWPENDRPRERLLAQGAGVLSDAELIAILLGTGGRGVNALELARNLIKAQSIFTLGKITPKCLAKLPGIGPAKAARILAACELGRRRERTDPFLKKKIQCPEDAARIAFARLRDADRECFLAILLDTKHQVLREELVSKGSLDQTLVHPRELFKTACEYSAAALILAHNHPSGDPQPSQADVCLTGQLMKAAKLLGITILDHVIIGDGKFVSLASEGIISNSLRGESHLQKRTRQYTKSQIDRLCGTEQKSA